MEPNGVGIGTRVRRGGLPLQVVFQGMLKLRKLNKIKLGEKIKTLKWEGVENKNGQV